MGNTASDSITTLVAKALNLNPKAVGSVLRLLDDKATVPFIARYRKEATLGMDEVQIRNIRDTAQARVELDKRRASIIEAIESQGKLTAELRAALNACSTKTALEDLYQPYKKKRKTRASIAREQGLAGLAQEILKQSQTARPYQVAAHFVNPAKGVQDKDAALSGARDIVAEIVADNPRIRERCRHQLENYGVIQSSRARNAGNDTRFEQYESYREPIRSIPSHRYLAIDRGEREGALKVQLVADEERIVGFCLREMRHNRRSGFANELEKAVTDSYRRLLSPSVGNGVRSALKSRADRVAIDVFANNLESLLLAAPLGTRSVIGIDPGIRTGCKCAVITATGAFIEDTVLHIGRNQNQDQQAESQLVFLCKTHKPFAVAVGNGTYGREALAFIRKVLKTNGLANIVVVPVNESGASIYSASDIARTEFPNLDLTVRGAISIARRLQDPLAELVKIDPKSIGVGQYQHDVDQGKLQQKLSEVVESCVNGVGVDLNTASASLLSFVAGIGPALSQKIVTHRNQCGRFSSRSQLKKVAGLGQRTYEQAAGFLRITNADNPLDGSAVHPERYALVQKMAREINVTLKQLVGSKTLAEQINLEDYVSDDVGYPTLKDIISELAKPGRDPRDSFEPPEFRDDIQSPEDLKPGMVLDGVVTNVTHFGAFVDVGVHQDGLVHISQLADQFVKDPHEFVRPGDTVKVRVLEVDLKKKRISLSRKAI